MWKTFVQPGLDLRAGADRPGGADHVHVQVHDNAGEAVQAELTEKVISFFGLLIYFQSKW
jgi:hypothetical protein